MWAVIAGISFIAGLLVTISFSDYSTLASGLTFPICLVIFVELLHTKILLKELKEKLEQKSEKNDQNEEENEL